MIKSLLYFWIDISKHFVHYMIKICLDFSFTCQYILLSVQLFYFFYLNETMLSCLLKTIFRKIITNSIKFQFGKIVYTIAKKEKIISLFYKNNDCARQATQIFKIVILTKTLRMGVLDLVHKFSETRSDVNTMQVVRNPRKLNWIEWPHSYFFLPEHLDGNLYLNLLETNIYLMTLEVWQRITTLCCSCVKCPKSLDKTQMFNWVAFQIARPNVFKLFSMKTFKLENLCNTTNSLRSFVGELLKHVVR